MGITFGILAHVDHGKTTLSEQILYHGKFLKEVGRVDSKNTFLDHNDIERERGITIFSEQANFLYKEKNFYLLDTPGHVDFAAELERSLFALDYAVLVISAVEGIQNHTNTIWNILQENKVPTFIFINKIDRTGADVQKVIQKIKERWKVDVVDFTKRFSEGHFDESLSEDISSLDENLLEQFIQDNFDNDLWIKTTKDMISTRKVFPVFTGSALNDIGVIDLLDGIYHLAKDRYTNDCDKLSAKVYKVSHDKQKNRITHLKVTKGILKVKDVVTINDTVQKINEIREYNAEKSNSVQVAKSGDLVGVMGLTDLMPGDVIGDETPLKIKLIPLMRADVVISEENLQTVLKCFKELESEDPLLSVNYNEILKTISINIAGKIQVEVLEKLFLQRFGIKIAFSNCKILYKESLRSKTYGCGHFEPLRHYAEVHLSISPAERGSGISFNSEVHVDTLGQNWQNLIKTHIFERQHAGVLTGSSLTDVHITLKNGRAYKEYTAGGDFRQATFRAVRHGLMNGDNILLEPYYKFSISADINFMGRILSDIEKLKGTFDTPDIVGDEVNIIGIAPVSLMEGYVSEFTSFTKGEGRLFLDFDGYRECHNQLQVVEDCGYDPESDRENTADSIFCAKGAGYNVPWKEAIDAMHLDILKD